MKSKFPTALLLLLLFLLPQYSHGFSMQAVTVSLQNNIINTTTTYSITINREYSPSNLPNPWNANNMIDSDTINIMFPSEFVLQDSYQCISTIGEDLDERICESTCDKTGINNITINGCFTNDIDPVRYINVKIIDIISPVPAKTFSYFYAIIGQDYSEAYPGSASITLAVATSVCQVTFLPPSYVNTTGTMSVTITPVNEIPISGTVIVGFPSQNYWSGDLGRQPFGIQTQMSCSSDIAGNGANCIGDSLNRLVRVNSLFISGIQTTEFSFEISNIKSPAFSNNNDKLTIRTTTGSFNLDVCSVSVTGLAPNLFNSTVSSTTNFQINKDVSLSFVLTLFDTITNNPALTNYINSFSIEFPVGSIFSTPVRINSPYGNPIATTTGNIISFTLSTNYLLNKGNTISFQINTYRTPSSTMPVTLKVNILMNSSIVQTTTTSFLPESTLLTFTVSNQPKTVNLNSSYTFVVTLPDPISSDGMIRIKFPDQLIVSVPADCLTISGTNTQNGASCTSTSHSVYLIGFASNTIPSGSEITLTVNGIINPPSVAQTQPFTMFTYYTSSQSTLVSSGTAGGIIADPQTLDYQDITVTPSSWVVNQPSVTYTVSFKNLGAIPFEGSIVLQIPEGIQASNSISEIANHCEGGISPAVATSSTNCQVSSNGNRIAVKFDQMFDSAGAPPNSIITLRINSSLTNPSSTRTISSFSISTKDSEGYLIDTIQGDITVSMQTPAAFSSISVIPSSGKNSDITEYTIKFSQLSDIQNGASIVVIFPPQIIPQTGATCADGSGNVMPCTISSQIVEVTLPELSANSNVVIKISQVQNAPSLKVSGPFQITTYQSDGISKYSEDTTTVTVQNTQPSQFLDKNFQFQPQMYGEQTALTFSFTPTLTSSLIGYAMVVLAGDFSIGTVTCDQFVGISGGQCQYINDYMYKVTGGFSTSLEVGFRISGFRSPKGSTNQRSTIVTYSTEGYPIDDFGSPITFVSSCTLPCMTCSGDPTICLGCYSDPSITLNIYLDLTNSKCVINCQLGYFRGQISSVLTCEKCDTSCLTCDIQARNCTSCDPISSTPYYYNDTSSNTGSCNETCTEDYYKDDSAWSCLPCISPCKTCIDVTQCLTCVDNVPHLYHFSGNNSCLTSCPLDISIGIGDACLACDEKCNTCQGQVDNCTSCADGAVWYGNQCLLECPLDLINWNDQCVQCSSPCATCSGTRDNCTSCLSTTSASLLYFNFNNCSGDPELCHYINKCVSNCPGGYYNNSPSGFCYSCQSQNDLHCDYCLYAGGQFSCSFPCKDDFVFFSQNKSCITVDEIPSGSVNISGNVLKCIDCLECEETQTKCTSCMGIYSLNQNRCITTCPGNMISILNICEPCQSPCSTCQTSTSNCLSCIADLPNPHYLNGNECQTACPTTSYGNISSLTCDPCQNNCQTCNSITFCLTCKPGFYLYQHTCKDKCPNGYTGIGGNCEKCHDFCSKCEGSIDHCLSCNTEYFIIPAEFSCVQNCPLPDLLPYSNNMTCIGCLEPCSTCSEIPTNCTSCLVGGLLENQCLDPCPMSYYLDNHNCLLCTLGCQTCISDIICETCTKGYFFYESSCLETCPSSSPVISETGSCVQCSTDHCSSCTSNDSCYFCSQKKLVYENKCIEQCPNNYETNGTFCLMTTSAKSLAESLKQNGIVPLPFSIASVLVIIVCLFSKFSYSETHLLETIYGILGFFEPAVNLYFIYLLWNSLKTFSLIMLLSIGAISCLYLVNLVSIIIINFTFCKDLRFKEWYSTRKGKGSYIIFSIFSLIFSFKTIHLIFSNLFNLQIFKCKLQHPSRLFRLQLMTFLSMSHSVWAMSMAAYNIYLTSQFATMLFFESIDLILIVGIQMVVGIFNIKKDDDFFSEKQDPSLVKKVSVQSDSLNTLIQPFDSKFQFHEKAQTGEYKMQKKMKTKTVRRRNNNDFQEQDVVGDGVFSSKYQMSKKINKKKVDKYQILSERSNGPSLGDPSSRGLQEYSGGMPKVNYKQISISFKSSENIENPNEINTQQNQNDERLETLEPLNVQKAKQYNNSKNDSHNIFQQMKDNYQLIQGPSGNRMIIDKIPTKLKKSSSAIIQNKNKNGEDTSNQLMDSAEKSSQFINIQQYPLGLENKDKLIKENIRKSSFSKKKIISEDVEEFQWDDKNNLDSIINPKSKNPLNKQQSLNSQIQDKLSGVKKQFVSENSVSEENLVFEQKEHNFDDSNRLQSSQNLNQSEEINFQMAKQRDEVLRKEGQNNTVVSNDRLTDVLTGPRSNALRESAVNKIETMDQSLEESEDEINNFPMYLKYKKIIEDNAKNYNSNQASSPEKQNQANLQKLTTRTGTGKIKGVTHLQKQQMFQKSQDQEFHDELNKQQLKEFILPKKNALVYRPREYNKTQQSFQQMSKQTGYKSNFSLQKNHESVRQKQGSVSPPRNAKFSSADKYSKYKDKRIESKELQRIYLDRSKR